MRIILLILLILLATLSFTEDQPINPALKSTLDTFETDTAKAYADYLKVTNKATDKANAALDTKLKAAMKANNLELATAIKKQMDDLTKGKTLAALETKWKESSSADSLLGNTPDPILGKWGNGSTVLWEFKPDGTGNHFWQGALLTFKWTKTDNTYSVTVQGHAPRTCSLTDKNTILLEPGSSIRMK